MESSMDNFELRGRMNATKEESYQRNKMNVGGLLGSKGLDNGCV